MLFPIADLVKIARQEVGVSRHLPFSHLVTPSVFENKNGELGCVIYLKGLPFDTCLNQEINSAKKAWHQALCQIQDQCQIQVALQRTQINTALKGEFADHFSKQLDQRYHQQFLTQPFYLNQWFLTLVHWGNRTTLSKTRKLLPQKRRQTLETLLKIAQQLITALSRFEPKLIGSEDEALGYSELLDYLSKPFNALQSFFYPEALQRTLNLYPQGNLASYLPRMQVSFGEAIQFEAPGGKIYYAKCLSIKEYGTETSPKLLDGLLNLNSEFLQTHSFLIEPHTEAQKLISRQIIKLQNSNDPAKSQIEALSKLQDDLASGHVKTGFYQQTLMLFSESLDSLKLKISEAVKIFGQAGLIILEESIGLEPAFWAQLPGNTKYMTRPHLITSTNFVDFCALHNYRTGYQNKNHLGSALSLLQTPSRTPLFFNYHAEGSGKPNDLTPGHTTIIGGNGSGKTVFLGFMDAQMGRYGGQSFIFDRDQGLEIYVKATGGTYLTLSPDKAISLNPFSLSDTPENRLFLKNFLAEICKEEQEKNLPSDLASLLSHCVDYAYDALLPHHRRLGTVVQYLPINFPRWSRIHQWIHGDAIRTDGEYAYLLDHQKDSLSLNTHKIGFDLTHLMSLPKSVLTGVLMYLFRRIEENLTGQRVSVVLDEGWMYLDHPYWQQRLKEWLPTLRKKNCHIVLATQSPESVVNSPISAVFFDNCATHIFFCNDKANFEKHYRHFNLTESEFDWVKNTPREKRLFLYKQHQESAVCQLLLSGLEDELAVFSGNPKTVQLLHQVQSELDPNSPPEIWLPLFHARRKQGKPHA